MDNMQVYLGVWTNWSRGAVMGATLTTTREYGNLLIALTAFFIPLVATRFWRICCFFLHRIHSTAEPKGAMHHQRQVLLRNATSMESAFIMLLSLIKSWSSRKHAKMGTLLPLVGFSLLIAIGFTVAGGFSSRISSGICDEVLVNGNNCAIVVTTLTLGASMDTFEASNHYQSRAYTDAANYAQQCYSDDSSGILGCDIFIVKNLKAATVETNRACPFQGDICRSNDTNIRLDTGYLDSHDHLGLNTPPNERFGYRYVLECAPLKTKGRVKHHTDLNNVTWARYDYGHRHLGGTDNRTLVDYSYQVEDLSYQYPKDYSGSVRGDFLLSALSSEVEYGKINTLRSHFTPIPELLRTDGDVVLVFLSGNGVYFFDAVDDDWYRATVEGKQLSSESNSGSHPSYHPVEAASPLACVEQWQWCNSNYQDERGCGPLGSGLDALYGASHLFNVSEDIWQDDRPSSNTSTEAQFIWQALPRLAGDLNINFAIKELKTFALASRSSSFSGIQYALPKNQWHLDVTNWWNTILAATQANNVNAAIGHTDPILRESSWAPINQYEQNLCNNQKIRSTDHASFSLFGLYFTYITGAIIIIVSLILEPIFSCLHDRAKYKQYEHLEWTTNATLQLHRLAHEEIGSQQWSGCTDSVPTVLPEANLASLNIEDIDHPTLTRITKFEREPVEVNSIKTAKEATNGSNTNNEDTVINEESSEDELTDHLGLGSVISSIRPNSWDPLQWTYSTAQSPFSDRFADV